MSISESRSASTAARCLSFIGTGPARSDARTYEPGEWEKVLIDWPEPIPFRCLEPALGRPGPDLGVARMSLDVQQTPPLGAATATHCLSSISSRTQSPRFNSSLTARAWC